MKTLNPKSLKQKYFREYGDIIDTSQKVPFEINDGRCLRYNDLANLDFTNGQAGISLFEAKKISLPYRFNFMEKHPLGSQAFIPVFGSKFMVIVAQDKNGRPGDPEVFITKQGQGVNYHKNVWHGILAPIEDPGLFVVIDWIGSGKNLDTNTFKDWYFIEKI